VCYHGEFGRSALTPENPQKLLSPGTPLSVDGGRIFYVGAKWGKAEGLGGQRKIDTVEH